MLFSKRRKSSDTSNLSTDAHLKVAQARQSKYRQLSEDFLGWLKDFALDEEDIDSASFYAALEILRARLQELNDSTRPQSVETHTAFIPAFIARQRRHLEERDTELREVVQVLTSAVIAMNSRNDAYDSSLSEQIENMTALSRLEDIRKLRSGLIAELTQLRELQEKKQAAESSSIQKLTSQVASLRTELELAQEESRRDGLTDIYNRRAFDAFLDGQLDTNGSRRSQFALLMLDLDNFKAINDNFGHLLGDRVLLAVVEICRSVIRSEDVFARFGGDEFAIIFPGASARIATRKGNEICKILKSRIFTVEETPERPETSLVLSVSIGVTACKAGDSRASLLKRVDTALYEAKRAGKNCVRSA
ncbi:GGDEF domain-containing protein [Chromatocurvus halotolerans]|uniref:diguanylate cyclase n=1 Tax=Chromatocurvus halotolerans TaxID=1132028 RepID=A0A4V2SBW8_9GAMM|nr:GGDEF domain-containing protein [Chromatocurvus halotolerans]TCO76630.1 diguanylate cyclase [Chromatocurvus halotolerans]